MAFTSKIVGVPFMDHWRQAAVERVQETDARFHDPASRSIALQFGDDVLPVVRARVFYALRVFAAIYGYRFAGPSAQNAEVACFYGAAPPGKNSPQVFHIPALYRDLQHSSQPQLMRFRFADEEVPLAFGVDLVSERPDWLGELFLWLSGSYERDIVKRDAIGRIPTSEMIFEREGLSPSKPFAGLLMAWMEGVLRHGNTREELPKAPSPVPGVEHIVLPTHDIDFYFVDRISTLFRLTKNLGIAVQAHRKWSVLSDNLRMFWQLLLGKRVGDYIPALLDAAEKTNFRSTFFAVARGGHRRDPNYSLKQIAQQLLAAAQRGFSVGLHGSYRSVMDSRSLRQETELLQAVLGRVLIGRQHWLRFARHEDLFAEIRTAELLSDSTLGFPDSVGFRNGASFAFPPYDFENERPHSFLEIPLVLMDGGLEAVSRSQKDAPQNVAEQVLRESRKYGWGGVSILWHNPIEPLAVPSAINDVFWRCAEQCKRFQEEWMSYDKFLACCLPRYQQAGLLEGIQLDG